MLAAVPTIEIADDADAAGRRSPDGEIHAGDTVDSFQVSTEFFVGVVMAAFGHQVKVEVAELEGEGVRIINFKRNAFVRAALNFITTRFGSSGLTRRPGCFEEAFGAEFDSVGDFCRILKGEICLVRPGKEKADGPSVFHGMRTEQRKGIGQARAEQCIDALVHLWFDVRRGLGLQRRRRILFFRHGSL